ncbi:MAG: GGDEF domain-containing protein [Acidimicrobiia bacterium]|nr:GGDEF domain-containing protein [Acidimicrobiia bacterium]
MDRRALLGLLSGAAGVALGAAAVTVGSALLGALAAACAVAAAGMCLVVASRLRDKDKDAEQLQRQITQLEDALMAEREAFESANVLNEQAEAVAAGAVRDSETGLLGEHYFETALEHRIATARRQLQPVALLLVTLDVEHTTDEGRHDVIVGFADILRDTLRESDTVCRLSASSFGVILEDTSEAGGVWAAERLRTALVRQRDALVRLAAGVAAYPTHALEAEQVLDRARGALASARASGSSRVEVASAD